MLEIKFYSHTFFQNESSRSPYSDSSNKMPEALLPRNFLIRTISTLMPTQYILFTKSTCC